MFEDISSF